MPITQNKCWEGYRVVSNIDQHPASFSMLYKTYTLVRPPLEHCAPILNPYFATGGLSNWFIHSPSIILYESSYRLEELNIHSLYCRGQRYDLIEVYKIILHFYYNIDSENVFTLQQGYATRGHQVKLLNQELIPTLF